MINAELEHVTTLKEFYSEIRRQQEEAHGDDYCEQHDTLKKYLSLPECNTYKELGTHQGGTAACAMLCYPKSVELIDKDQTKYNKFLKPIAEQFCKENDIELIVKEEDSASPRSLEKSCDILLIDSYHKAFHMKQELDLHGPRTRKYIIAHDTYRSMGRVNQELNECLLYWAKIYSWKEIERSKNNVGYTVLGKK